MYKIILILPCLFFFQNLTAQESDSIDYSTHVSSLDNIMETLYGVISGDKGVERDWDLFLYLFAEDAKLIPSGPNKAGEIGFRLMSPKDYVNGSGQWLVENGFHETEIKRSTDLFGSLAHVFTTYEAFHSKTDTEPFMRGINSVQLINDGTRWWILNIYWRQESDSNPIPSKYLPN